MQVTHAPVSIPSLGLAAAIALAPGGAQFSVLLGAASFWLTVALAAAGSVLSALCIAEPVPYPRLGPYTFIGQWFVWLSTPLLWGSVAASAAYPWLKPVDLLLAAAALAFGGWGAHTVCELKWRRGATRRLYRVPYLARPQGHS